jgi:hypothetical protein
MGKVEVIARLRFVGFHRWPGAPDAVAYLANTHRHEFHIEARKQVSALDREIEFITLKRQIGDYLSASYPAGHLGARSCEMLATELCAEFNLSSCEVLEDGENGARVIA